MTLKKIRNEIDIVDKKIVELLSKRVILSLKAKSAKQKLGVPIEDKDRESEIMTRVNLLAKQTRVSQNYIAYIYKKILGYSLKIQK